MFKAFEMHTEKEVTHSNLMYDSVSKIDVRIYTVVSAPLFLFSLQMWRMDGEMRGGEDGCRLRRGGMSWQAPAYWDSDCHICSRQWKNFTTSSKAPQTIFQNSPRSVSQYLGRHLWTLSASPVLLLLNFPAGKVPLWFLFSQGQHGISLVTDPKFDKGNVLTLLIVAFFTFLLNDLGLSFSQNHSSPNTKRHYKFCGPSLKVKCFHLPESKHQKRSHKYTWLQCHISEEMRNGGGWDIWKICLDDEESVTFLKLLHKLIN